jgi:hypothetical protein
MKMDKFIETITQKYQEDAKEAEKEINDFVKKTFAKESDTLWEQGAQNMVAGSILYLLEKGKLSVDGIKDLFMLENICEKRRQIVYKTLVKASIQVQKYFVGIVDNADTTFKGYFGIFKNYVLTLERM